MVPGKHVAAGGVRGYYIDLGVKAKTVEWPPPWLRPGRDYVKVAQWGLGSFERYLAGQGEERLRWAIEAGRHLVETQERTGPNEGGWEFLVPYAHTFDIQPPWISAMSQGEGASLLVRLHEETGEDSFAEAALRAVKPLSSEPRAGGVMASLGDGAFPQEYPTIPPSHVLNGGIFALWGLHDVWIGLGSGEARQAFDDGLKTLIANLHRWDTGTWSRYDLYPHPVVNLASHAYHLLHTNQLRATNVISPDETLARTADRFASYARSSVRRADVFLRKVVFRMKVPRGRSAAGQGPGGD
jgi:heparosan-N-sulfate-glucuronate 5-epimerase